VSLPSPAHHDPQIIEWFEQFTDGVAQTHTELGESQQVAETLAKEVTDFETTTKVHNAVQRNGVL
jgi:hypothetical protein